MRKKKNVFQLLIGMKNRILHIFARTVFPSGFRVFLNRRRGVKIGRNVLIGINVFIDDDSPQLITIKDNVTIAAGCILIAHSRDLADYKQGEWFGDKPFRYDAIIIEENAFIGVGSIILPGVTIGRGAIIGAGSVVSRNIPEYCMAMGVPAKVVKRFEK